MHLDKVGLGPRPPGILAIRVVVLAPRASGLWITRDDVLVDFGSGMGRAVYVAARRYRFGRVVGVELSQAFNDVALENLRRRRQKLRCPNVEIVTGDATTYVVPDDMTYAYLYNPFVSDVFAAVLANIVASLDRRPRRVTICYANPLMDNMILATGRFTRIHSSRGLRPDISHYLINVYQSIT